MKVALIVEPDPMVLDVARMFFQELGYRTKTARTAHEALEEAEEGPIDVMFVECHLGRADHGLELVTKIRFTRPTLPVIYTTGSDLDAFAFYTDPVLLKPYSMEQLRETRCPSQRNSPQPSAKNGCLAIRISVQHSVHEKAEPS